MLGNKDAIYGTALEAMTLCMLPELTAILEESMRGDL